MQFLLVLSGLVAAVAAQSSGLSSIVNRQCNTRYSASPTTRIRTTTYRASITRTVSRTLVISGNVASTVTVAPATFFTTSTSTSFATVTAASSTDTFTQYQTVTQTSTFTAVQSFTTATTVLSTTLIAGVTQTIPAPAGFTALANTPGFTPKQKRNAIEEKLANIKRASKARVHLPALPEVGKSVNRRQNTGSSALYPVGIQCTSRTTFFATATTTSTAAGGGATSTVTVTAGNVISTITVTAAGTLTVVPADATRFVTVSTFVSATTTSTSTFVTTQSNVVTINAPAATQYAQCTTQNLVSSVFAGNQIGTLTFNGDFLLQSVNVTDTTGVGCCTVCATTTNCAGYAQAPASGGNICYFIVTDGQCDGSQTFTDTYNYYQVGAAGYTVGNGQCGALGPEAGPPANQDSTAK